MLRQFEPIEEAFGLGDRHRHDLGDILAAYLNIERLGLEAGTLAGGADGLASVAGEHHPVLYLVKVLLDMLEEVVDAMQPRRAMPQEILLLLGQIIVGAMDREVVTFTIDDKVAEPFAHDLAFPADDGALVDR